MRLNDKLTCKGLSESLILFWEKYTYFKFSSVTMREKLVYYAKLSYEGWGLRPSLST